MQEQPKARQLQIEPLCVCCAVLQLSQRLVDEDSVVRTPSTRFSAKVWRLHMHDDATADCA